MNATAVETEVVSTKTKSIFDRDRSEGEEIEAENSREPEFESSLSVAKTLEQRIAPQHWGINE